MSFPRVESLPYTPDTPALFGTIAHRPFAAYLDSGIPGALGGRFDILAADPMSVLVTRGEVTEIITRHRREVSHGDPFDLLREQLLPHTPSIDGLPFPGGAIGYLGYDLGRRLETLPVIAQDDACLPEMVVGIHDWAVVVDHALRKAWFVGQGRDPETRARWGELVSRFASRPRAGPEPGVRLAGPVRSNMSRESYALSFHRIQRYIRDGDCYQVNLAQRFTAPVEGDPWSIYRALRRVNPAPYGAYLSCPDFQVLSTSPERFLSVRKGRVTTEPIKGTRPRSQDPDRDRALAEELRASSKDRAENLMIVDLLRNDIGKNCAAGSVAVPHLFEVRSFATVHHLVSTVTGKLDDGRDALHLLAGCFPGGSVTGAPKLRAMEVIEELEPHRRGVYCGAIGYVGFDGAMDTNIAIRTPVHREGKLSFSAGGGIVADSVLEEEYRETYDKAAAVFEVLGQGIARNG
ncbi:MAG: aminodeoxychorismate synthase component I [Pseudomonadota bacterium]|nr:aminodeoxychorismate synthase component I [Pseudomonadota bacterium]